MPKAAIYCRISSDPEGRELGVQRQEQDCRALAQRLQADVVEVFIDNDVSASTRSKKPRPEFEEMMHAAEDGAFDMILAYSNSRLTRRPWEWDRLIRLYENHRVQIHTIASSSADLATADGRAVARTIAAWDAAEAERTSERALRAQRQLAENGKAHGLKQPFGWMKDGVTLDPLEHKLIIDLAERLLAGESLRSLTKEMNEHGWRSRNGKLWSPQAVKATLTSARMIGWRSHHGELAGKGNWEPALSEDVWRQLVALFNDPSRRVGGNARVNLLTGIARCGECDTKMSIKYGGLTRYYCPACRLSRTQRSVDPYVEGAVRRLLASESAEAPPVIDAEAAQRAERLRLRIAEVKAAFADDDQTVQDLLGVLRDLKHQLSVEEAKLVPPRRPRVIAAALDQEWDEMTLDQRRAVVDALVEVRLMRVRKGYNKFDPASVQLIRRQG